MSGRGGGVGRGGRGNQNSRAHQSGRANQGRRGGKHASRQHSPHPGSTPKQRQRALREQREQAAAAAAAAEANLGPVGFGFVRGTNPDKWRERWQQRHPQRPLTFEPLDETPIDSARGTELLATGGLLLVRAPSVSAPRDAAGTRLHAVKLYEERIGLIVPKDSDFAELAELDDTSLLDLAMLLDHPGHLPDWPRPTPWVDPTFRPATVAATAELVATGLGVALAALPLAQHVTDRGFHRVIPLADTLPLSRTAIYAVWQADGDSDTVQELVGLLRGRTAHSGRTPGER